MPISLGTTTVTALYLGTTSITSAYLGNTQVFGGSFTPLSLFSGGAQGIWLDPSDLSTMFSDRAGTIQVTTPGTVVGKRLDKSGRGNHAVAPTDAARPIYGIEPKVGRRNLLTWSEDASNAIWLKTGATASGQEVRETTANSGHLIFQSASYTGSHAFSLELQAVGRDLLTIWMGTSSGTFAFQYTFSTNTISSVGSALSGVTSSVLTGGWVRLTGAVLTPNRFQVSTGAPGATYVGDPATGFNIRNAQLETGSTATAYQRVTTAYDVTESGVAATHYVQYDGSDDSMSTAAIDFTGTDKVSVFAGVRKLSDAATGILIELSSSVSTNNGTFNISAPSGANNRYAFSSKGTVLASPFALGYTSPISNIVTGLGDISGDTATLRVNGTQVAQATTDQGTGNFGNYAMFIGRRNNASSSFNGKDYGLIVVGKAASAGEITDTETWLAAKTSEVTI